MRRLIAILALSALVAACQSGSTHPVVSPTPTPTPHTAATDAVLQSADIPAGLSPCLGSGPIDVYVTTLAHADATLAGQVAAQWEQLRVAGATAGAISLFTASPAACNAELAATSNVKSVTAFVGLFADPGQADRAWGSGVFGFEPPVQLACWHKSIFIALVVVSNLDAATFRAATTAIDARLN